MSQEDRRDEWGASPYESGPDFEPAASPEAGGDGTTSAQSPSPAPGPAPVTGSYHADQQHMQQYPVQPYGQPSGGYQQPPYTAGYVPAPEHPRSTTVLVLGILGFMTGITGFFGWYIGSKAKKEIMAGGTPYRWDGSLKVGHILSIISSALTIGVVAIYLLMFVALFALIAVA